MAEVNPPLNLGFRAATDTDIDLIVRLVTASFRDVAASFRLTEENASSHPAFVTPSAIRRSMDQSTIFLIGSSRARVPCGCVGVHLPRQGVCAIEKLAVLPHFRYQGVGGELLRIAVQQGSRLGATTIEAAIIADHVILRRWYNARGFVHGKTEHYTHRPFTIDFLYLSI